MSQCVIVLEDDHDLLSVVTDFLEEADYRVIPVTTVDELVIQAGVRAPCVALVDSTDPVRFNLWHIGEQLEKLGVPAVAFTAHASAKAQFEEDTHGFVGVISKPFDVDEFLTVVNTICWEKQHVAAS